MTEGKTEIVIATVPDRDEAVAEIWSENSLFAELRHENGSYIFEIYPRQDGNPWIFGYDELLQMLSTAKTKLLGCSS